jgi:hypothetical protein
MLERLSSAGAPTGLWVEAPHYRDGITDLAVGPDGEIYAASYSYGTGLWRFDPETLEVTWSRTIYAAAGIAKIDVALALDASDQVLVAYNGRNLVSADSDLDCGIARYDADGVADSGWAVLFDSLVIADIVVDGNGNIYAVGAVGSGNARQWAIKKLDAAGQEITTGWDKQLSPGGPGGATAAVTDAAGALYVAGSYGSGWAIKKFLADGSGVTGWDVHVPGFDGDTAHAIVIDAAGYVYVAGALSNRVTPTSGPDFHVTKLSPSGAEVTTGGWPHTYDGGFWQEDAAHALAVLPDGAILAAGTVSQRLHKHSGKDALVLRLANP